MLNNFIIAVNAVMPMFVIIAIGFYCRRKGKITDSTTKNINNIAFHLFLPCKLFLNIFYSTWQPLNTGFILISVGGVFLILFLAIAIFSCFIKDKKRIGAMVHGVFRSNYIILGMPLVSALCNQEALVYLSIMTAIIVPLFNIFGVVTLEIFGAKKSTVRTVFTGIIRNPLIISTFIGIIAKIVNFPLKEYGVIEKTITYLGDIATPIMLFVLGASFNFIGLKSMKRDLTICTVSKLIISPAIILFISYLSKFNSVEFAILLAIYATPPAANTYNMAVEMNGDDEFAANLVVTNSLLSCFTIVIWIFLLKQLNVL